MRVLRFSNLALPAVLLAAACGGNNAGSTTKTDMSTKGTDMPATSCDGVQTTVGTAKVDILTYSFSSSLTGCDPSTMASFNNAPIGIWEYFAEAMQTPVHVIIPTNCMEVAGTDDPKAGGMMKWNGTCPVSMTGCPTTFMSVATIKTAWTGMGGATVTTVGIVNATHTWAAGKAGTFWIEDGTGMANSGIEIYVPKTVTTAPPVVGDLVTVTGTTGVYSNAKQISATSFAVIGSGYQRSAAIQIPAASLANTSTSQDQYEGLFVQPQGTLMNTMMCPAELTFGG